MFLERFFKKKQVQGTDPSPQPAIEQKKPQSGIREKVLADMDETRKNEIQETIANLKSAEDDWEKRLGMLKLINFIAESQHPDDLVVQSEYSQKLQKKYMPEGEVIAGMDMDDVVVLANEWLKYRKDLAA